MNLARFVCFFVLTAFCSKNMHAVDISVLLRNQAFRQVAAYSGVYAVGAIGCGYLSKKCWNKIRLYEFDRRESATVLSRGIIRHDFRPSYSSLVRLGCWSVVTMSLGYSALFMGLKAAQYAAIAFRAGA